MALTKAVISGLIDEIAENMATGAGLNLLRTARNTAKTSPNKAAELLARAGSSRAFGGALDDIEVTALRRLFDPKQLGITPMDVEQFKTVAKAAVATPLVLNARNFPIRQSQLGFVPLTGQNINKPGFILADYTGRVRDRFIDEGSRNLEAAVALDPVAAAQYAKFYSRAQKGLEATGVPLDRVGGAWAVTSAKADPEWNKVLLERILRDPTGATTSQRDQMLALRYLAGDVEGATAELGSGKRFNFLMNSTDPMNPAYLTADTRYAQNLQGILNTYKRAPFTGLFDPKGRRYGEIYVEPGLEAARRLGMLPNEVQAAAWGNWRNRLAGIPTDLRGDLFASIADFDYDPELYVRALEEVANTSPEAWDIALATRKAADKAAKKAVQ